MDNLWMISSFVASRPAGSFRCKAPGPNAALFIGEAQLLVGREFLRYAPSHTRKCGVRMCTLPEFGRLQKSFRVLGHWRTLRYSQYMLGSLWVFPFEGQAELLQKPCAAGGITYTCLAKLRCT